MNHISRDNVILSTAAFCLWNISIQEKLEYCHKLGFKNVQIALSTVKMLIDFSASLEQVPQILNFKDVSIHAPWCGIKYGNNKKTMKILECLKSIEQCIPVSRYVFNYDVISQAEILYNSGLNILIRNPVKPDSLHGFSSIIQRDGLTCVFDLNKAARNKGSMNLILDRMHASIAEIHVSGFIDGKNRMPLVSTNQEYLLKHLEPFNLKKIPVIIEGLFPPKDFASIIAEKNLVIDHLQDLK